MIDLDNEEKEILEAYESGKLSAVADAKETMARHVQCAAATLKNGCPHQFRLSSKDLLSLQRKALSGRNTLVNASV